jgi:hypothetical protein
MALVVKAAVESDLCQLKFTSEQQLLRSFDPSLQEPSMGRHPCCLAKTAGEMAGGQATFRGEVRDRGVAVEMSFDI